MSEEEEVGLNAKANNFRIPRPPNAFMIFGKNRRKSLAEENKDLPNKEISRILGNEWQNLDQPMKEYYQSLATEATLNHKLKYPGYYYSPLEARQRKALRKRKMRTPKMKGSPPSHQTGPTPPESKPTLKPYRVYSPYMFRHPMNPMVRPMFMPGMHPRFGPPCLCRVPFGNHLPNFRFPPNYGFIPYQTTSPALINYRNGDIKPSDPSNSQLRSGIAAPNKSESDPNATQMPDIGLLSSYLPPMINPQVEAQEVLVNEEPVSGSDVAPMANAEVEVSQEFVLPDQKDEVMADKICAENPMSEEESEPSIN